MTPTEPTGDRHSPARMVIGIGASAGGVEALTALVRELPLDLRAAVLVVLHVSPAGTSVLASILDRAGPLPAIVAEDGAVLRESCIQVAPPDRHLLVDDGVVRLSAGPRENGHRPAIDPMFRAISTYGVNAIGVILSGTRDDGTVGLASIKSTGGKTFVQSPAEAAYRGMIQSAIAHVDVDAVLPVGELAAHLARMCRMQDEIADAAPEGALEPTQETSTRYTCPECGGHLSRRQRGDIMRFRCEVGHAYSPGSLNGEQALAVEGALWAATRMLGDRSTLLDEMAGRARSKGQDHVANGFHKQAEEARRAGEAVRDLLEGGSVPTSGASETDG